MDRDKKVILCPKSSNIMSIERDGNNIIVTFHKNRKITSKYIYYGVSEDMWNKMLEYTGSYGKYIKGLKLDYKKLS